MVFFTYIMQIVILFYHHFKQHFELFTPWLETFLVSLFLLLSKPNNLIFLWLTGYNRTSSIDTRLLYSARIPEDVMMLKVAIFNKLPNNNKKAV